MLLQTLRLMWPLWWDIHNLGPVQGPPGAHRVFCEINDVPSYVPPLKKPLSSGSSGCISPIIVLPLLPVSLVIASIQNMPWQHLLAGDDCTPWFSGMSLGGFCWLQQWAFVIQDDLILDGDIPTSHWYIWLHWLSCSSLYSELKRASGNKVFKYLIPEPNSQAMFNTNLPHLKLH